MSPISPRNSQPLSIIYRSIEDLELDVQNPRQHTDHQIRQLAKSIEAFGFNVPFLIDRNLRVVAGHGRLAACKLLKIRRLPTICLDHLSEAQARGFAIADNRLAETATWNEQLLAEQFKALGELDLDFTLEATGFEMGEIDLLVEGLTPAVDGEADPSDELPQVEPAIQVTQSGDLWRLGRNRIICGDALHEQTYASVMNGQHAAAVFIDPPYNVRINGHVHVAGNANVRHDEFAMASGEMSKREFTLFLRTAFSLLARSSEAGALHFVCMDWRHLDEILAAAGPVYPELKNLCVWVKDSGGMGSFYRSQHELVFIFKNGKGNHRNNFLLGQHGRYRTNVWQYPRVKSRAGDVDEANAAALHPTVKPVALVADAIMDSTARGEIVLDSFLGSGTTLIAAERSGRTCYGIELDPTFVDLAIHRWQAFTRQSAIHIESGRSFGEIEEVRLGQQQ